MPCCLHRRALRPILLDSRCNPSRTSAPTQDTLDLMRMCTLGRAAAGDGGAISGECCSSTGLLHAVRCGKDSSCLQCPWCPQRHSHSPRLPWCRESPVAASGAIQFLRGWLLDRNLYRRPNASEIMSGMLRVLGTIQKHHPGLLDPLVHLYDSALRSQGSQVPGISRRFLDLLVGCLAQARGRMRGRRGGDPPSAN